MGFESTLILVKKRESYLVILEIYFITLYSSKISWFFLKETSFFNIGAMKRFLCGSSAS